MKVSKHGGCCCPEALFVTQHSRPQYGGGTEKVHLTLNVRSLIIVIISGGKGQLPPRTAAAAAAA